MKVLNILPNTNLAGTEQVSLRFMTGLQRDGFEFRVLSLTKAGPMKDIFEKNGIITYDMDYRGKGGWRSFIKLRELLNQIIADYSPDLIIQTSHSILTSVILAGHKVPKILSIHFHHTGVKPVWQWKQIYKYCYRHFQYITFPSEYIRNEVFGFIADSRNKLKVARNPLPEKELVTSEDKRRAKLALGISENALVIGNSSQLIKRKRLDVFLDVAKKIVAKYPSACFVIAGDGDDAAELKAYATSYGLDGNIKWLGWQKDLTTFYHSLDFMLFNSDWDAFPTTPLEAMAYGIPIVASAVNSGLKEVVNSSKVGMLLNSHDIDKMADYILAVNGGNQENTGQAGRERVMEVCNFNHCVEVYRSLLEKAQTSV